MSDLQTEIGKQLKVARKRQQLSLKDVSEKIGVHQANISLSESGKQNLTMKTLETYLNLYKLKIKIFIDHEKSK